MEINWPTPRKGTWAWKNKETHEEVKNMLIAGVGVMEVVRETGCPQRTVSGVLAKITQRRNEIGRQNRASNARMHPGLMLWA